MKYAEFLSRERFDAQELLAFGHGRLIDDAPETFETRLPAPPMLMLDRVTSITHRKHRGRIVAERDVRIDDWFFQCHFLDDPVQPGCLGVDAIWQMLGLYCAVRGGLGSGRALGCGEVEFSGQIRPHDKLVRYDIEVVRFVHLADSGSSIVVLPGSHRRETRLNRLEYVIWNKLRSFARRRGHNDAVPHLYVSRSKRTIKTEPGDCIIFDQRLLHAGGALRGAKPKYSVFLSYGIDNSHARNHRAFFLKRPTYSPEVPAELRDRLAAEKLLLGAGQRFSS